VIGGGVFDRHSGRPLARALVTMDPVPGSAGAISGIIADENEIGLSDPLTPFRLNRSAHL